MTQRDDPPPAWLAERLASLPAEQRPGRSLWPGIARRVYARRYGAALAASLLAGMVAVLVPWRAPAPVPANNSFAVGLRVGLAQVDALYANTRKGLRRDIETRIARLPGAAAMETRRALVVLDAASRQLRETLARDPAGAELLDQLLETYQRELELLEILGGPNERKL